MKRKITGKLLFILMTLLLVLAVTAGCASGAAKSFAGTAAKAFGEPVLAASSGSIEIVSSTYLAKKKKKKNQQNNQTQQSTQTQQTQSQSGGQSQSGNKSQSGNQSQNANQQQGVKNSQNTGTAAASSKETKKLDEKGTYTSKDDVALYIHIYRKLPGNFITKNKARQLGWPGGDLEPYAPGKCIGGDYFGNYDDILPDGNYRECDIDTLGKSKRGAKRIIYSDKGDIYYTDDHYETFTLLYTKDGPATKKKVYGSK